MAKRKKSPAVSKPESDSPATTTAPQPAETETDEELAQARRLVAVTPCPGCLGAGTRIVFRVRKEGPNLGRVFAKCTDCQRFDWLTDVQEPTATASTTPEKSRDTERDALQARATPCPKCGKPRRAQRVSKQGPNHGRLFLAWSDRDCNSFEWSDTVADVGHESSTEAGLLHAIREAPDDDGPRHIYADWLDDHDQPERAELIRVQCELFRQPFGAEAAQLRQREQDLLAKHADDWMAPLKALGVTGSFRRGLLEHVEMTAFDFSRRADKLFAAAPVLALTTPATDHVGVGFLLRCRPFSLLRELTFADGYPLRRKGAKLLVESPAVANLAHLGLCGQELTRPAIHDLAASPHLARLTHLDLSINLLPPGALATLAGSPHLANLVSLDLSGNRANDADTDALANSPHLTKLSSLYLDLRDVSLAALGRLLHSANLAGLTTLCLGYANLGEQGVEELLGGVASAGKLTSLTLYSCGLTAAAVEALANAPCLGNLAALSLEFNSIGDEGARALASSTHLKRLGLLDLNRCDIHLAGARALADSNLPDHLGLDVGGNRFGKEGTRALGRFAPPGPKKMR